jgi:hypothetical protein
LIQQAERAQAAGQREGAQRLLLRAEAQAPGHPLVLNEHAIDLLQNGSETCTVSAPEWRHSLRTHWPHAADGRRPCGFRM